METSFYNWPDSGAALEQNGPRQVLGGGAVRRSLLEVLYHTAAERGRCFPKTGTYFCIIFLLDGRDGRGEAGKGPASLPVWARPLRHFAEKKR